MANGSKNDCFLGINLISEIENRTNWGRISYLAIERESAKVMSSEGEQIFILFCGAFFKDSQEFCDQELQRNWQELFRFKKLVNKLLIIKKKLLKASDIKHMLNVKKLFSNLSKSFGSFSPVFLHRPFFAEAFLSKCRLFWEIFHKSFEIWVKFFKAFPWKLLFFCRF